MIGSTPDREHGTHNCYVHGPDRAHTGRGCRCEPCRTANANYEKERARRVAPPYIDAEPARAHVRELMSQGVGLKTIVKRSGVAQGTLWKLVYGRNGVPSKRIRPETADRLLAVTGTMQADGAKIPAKATWKIVGQLLERGWTKVAIARELGQKGPGLQLGRREVTAGHARTIRSLLDKPVPPRTYRGRVVEQPQPDRAADRREALRRLAEREARAHYRALAKAEEAGAAAEPVDYELPVLVIGGGSWRRTAPCRRPDVPSWLFFPNPSDAETIAAAKAVCATCPHQQRCLAEGQGEEGVWGGLTEAERSPGLQAAS